MPGKSFAAVLIDGLKPGAVKASVESWLGQPIRLTDGDFWRQWGSAWSWGTSMPVTVNSVLQLATAWSCVRLIAETMATLPLGFYERKTNGSRSIVTSHPLYEILHNQPNADMTAVIFWEVILASLLLWGNAYVEIIFGTRSIVALNFLHPARVTVKKLPGGGYQYLYRDYETSVERTISEDHVMHILAFSTDGRCGLSPISFGANVFGTAMETDKASAETFRHAMRSPGIMTMNQFMNPEQRNALRKHIEEVQESGGVMVIEMGQRFDPLTFKPADAELLSSREYNIAEICRWFKIDPAMVGHGGKDSNWGTGLEQKMLWFLTFTLRPWCVRIEQAIRKSLLAPAERSRFFAEFAIEGLLRADSTARSEYYSKMTQNGIMTRDQVRKLENFEPMGGNAEVLTVQSNLVPLDKLGEVAAPVPNPLATLLDGVNS